MNNPNLHTSISKAQRGGVSMDRFRVTPDEVKRIRHAERKGHDAGLRMVLQIMKERHTKQQATYVPASDHHSLKTMANRSSLSALARIAVKQFLTKFS